MFFAGLLFAGSMVYFILVTPLMLAVGMTRLHRLRVAVCWSGSAFAVAFFFNGM